MMKDFIRAGAIEIATSLYGCEIREEPESSNAGFWVEMFQSMFGGKKGWAWCMYFVQYCFYNAHLRYAVLGMKSPLLKYHDGGSIDLGAPNGHCYSVWHHALEHKDLSVLQAADIADGAKIPRGSVYIRYGADRTGHTGIILSHWQDDDNHQRDKIKTIEGNASNAVSIREYSLAELMSKDLKGVIY